MEVDVQSNVMVQQRPTRQPPDKFGAPGATRSGGFPRSIRSIVGEPHPRARSGTTTVNLEMDLCLRFLETPGGAGVRKEGLPLSLMDSPIASRKQCRRIRAAEAAFCAESVEDFEAPAWVLAPLPLSGPLFLPSRINCWQIGGLGFVQRSPRLLFWRPMSPGPDPYLRVKLKKREAASA